MPVLLLRRLQIYVILGRHVTYVTDTRRVIHEQRYNNFSSDSIRTYSISKSQFEKVHPSASPTNRISSVGHEMKVLLPQGRYRNFSHVSNCKGRQFGFKGFDKVTGKVDFNKSSNFTRETSDSFSATDTNTFPEKNMTLKSVITLDQQIKKGLSW